MQLFFSRPLSLNCIREKLDSSNANHYQNVQGFLDDCKLLFANAKQFYEASSCWYFFKPSLFLTINSIFFVPAGRRSENLLIRQGSRELFRVAVAKIVTQVREACKHEDDYQPARLNKLPRPFRHGRSRWWVHEQQSQEEAINAEHLKWDIIFFDFRIGCRHTQR